ncbi:Ribosomal RNA small subunit methyltransferase H [Geodia barretti]|uniref:Ribosomal RNA small subunit methyltransferase H n=1 Tax=Geodia barretti TaxID=519541 RepID=A0AA35SNU9_GEOBA|nr:Ribosomal RNA small subunit methyltransferase H [Geodia barretti]
MGVYIDGTVGLGGHSTAILETSAPNGRVIGIDLDVEALTIAKSRLHVFGERYSLINGNFAEMDVLLERHSVHAVDGILLDLGVSSLQLDAPHRGFSFNHTGPLDMRIEREAALTAMQVVNDSPMDVLVEIFKRYGEERFAKRIAHRIIQTRRETPIATTTQLAEIVKQAVPHGVSKIHPATRVFQALRIHINAELENLAMGLDVAIQLLKPGGCLCVIAFHSLEDRIVKHRFRTCARTASLEILTKRPILPDAVEVQHNPRARSAKLRVARKL